MPTARWQLSLLCLRLISVACADVPDVVKEEYREDSLPLSGGLGAGAVSAGALPHDRKPTQRALPSKGAKTSAQKEKQEKEEASKGPKVRPPTAAFAGMCSGFSGRCSVLLWAGEAFLRCCLCKIRGDKGRDSGVSEGACGGVVAQISYKLIPPGTPEHEAAMADAD